MINCQIKSDIGFNQLALLKAIEISDPIESIKAYLEISSETDSQLKQSLSSNDKSYSSCWNYVQIKAKNHLKSKSGHIAPSVIFSWSIHYFIESKETILNEIESLGGSSSKQQSIQVNQKIEIPVESAADRLNRIKNRFNSVKDTSDENS